MNKHEYADSLKNARNTLGRSKSAMAKILGTSYQTYHHWEEGHSIPSPRFRGKVEKVIEIAESMSINLEV